VGEIATGWTSPEFPGKPEERAAAMFREALVIEQQQKNIEDTDLDTAMVRMFEQRPTHQLAAYTQSGGGIAELFGTARAVQISEWNILRAVLLTAWAMLSRSKVRGRFITSRGKSTQKKRAEDATRWLDGWTDEAQVHRIAGRCLMDAETCRYGVAQLYEDDSKVKLQRCLPHEVMFDQVGGMLGEARVIHRKRPMSKASLMKFAKTDAAKAAVRNANTIDLLDGDGSTSDMVLVRESYALPTKKGAGDGWHCIAIDGQDGGLVAEEWKKPWWPFILFRWDEAFMGMAGISLASQLESIQTELNYMAWVERKTFRLLAGPWIAIQRGSKIVKSQLTNQIGAVLEYTTTPPVVLVKQMLPPEFYMERDKRVDKMYEIAGIAKYVSEGQTAPNADSGVAKREAMDAQGIRLQSYAQRAWEAPIVEIYTKAVEMAADITKERGSYEVRSPGTKDLEVVDFKGTVTDLKNHAVTIYPTGFLPLTPAARLDFILQMLNAKLWDVDRCRQALSDLDVDYEQTMENQIQRLAVTTFEEMLFEGKPHRPTELDVANYTLIIKTASVYLALARNEKVGDENMSLATRYLDELDALEKEANPAPPPPPAAPPMAPPGVPGMPIAA
jgi:hypothetical protein